MTTETTTITKAADTFLINDVQLRNEANILIAETAVRFVTEGGEEFTPEQEETILQLQLSLIEVYTAGHVAIEFKAACARLRRNH